MSDIVIFGAGGHAKAVIDTIEQQGRYRIIGLLDANQPTGKRVYGYEILGDDSWLFVHEHSVHGAVIAIGDNWTRAAIATRLEADVPQLAFPTIVHPAAHVARGASVGAGSVVMAGAVIGSDASLGQHCIMYPGSIIEHDGIMEDYASFAPRAAAGGNVKIGSHSAIGIGATVIHGIAIGGHCVIGAGATVVKPVSDQTVAYGTPARIVRTRERGERYL
ncbi:acetyltransferase [Paenibacillus chungangensis]|uniref:Acetyltransferase n=1 Tax=Paenibacillus chungangensis TaxID=696535 RepID=A0ABW3HVT8_9BACL